MAKIARSGRRIVWASFIGGRGGDSGIGNALDSGGSVYVSGSTESRQSSFPVRVGPDLSFNGPAGDADAFIAKFSALTCMGRSVTQVGTAGRDVLRGTARRDVIAGAGGNDLIDAGAGDDLLCGGIGNDRLLGRSGRDRMDAGRGADACDADADVESVRGCEGSAASR